MSKMSRKPGTSPSGFAVVMEADADLSATICSALRLEGHRVESVLDCAGVLDWRKNVGPVPDELLLALGAAALDPNWDTLRVALDEDKLLAKTAVIVLLTIRNGLTFPARARLLQKPFAIEDLTSIVAADIEARTR
jgi:hypothetical protein